MHQIFIEGLFLQASLIFALGAQNLFVLEAGLKKENHIVVSFICFLCDFFLIMLGVAGAATFFNQFPQLKIIVGISGVLFLLYYGLSKLKSKTEIISLKDIATKDSSLKRSILKSIAFSTINPHAYLDGIILIGGYSTKYSILSERFSLGLGASFFSLIWFLALSHLAFKMKSVFESEKQMKIALNLSGILLIFLSAKLSLEVSDWIWEFIDPTTIAKD